MTTQPTLFDPPRIPLGELCDTDEIAVAATLNQCIGAARAIQVNALASSIGIPSRKCQSIVRHLIVEHGAPIGTSMREPYGWYLAETEAEMDDVIALHRSRALAELETMAKLRKTTVRAVLARIQTELDVA